MVHKHKYIFLKIVMRRLDVLDGSGYVFRAYYWFPELTDKDGHNVNAIYWFFRMLFKLWQRKPQEFVIAWDSPKKTKRKESYEWYKANRVKMPDDFKRQMRMIKDIVWELGIPFLEMPGYEADDIIATIVEQEIGTWSFEKWVCIVSSDKDLKQLLRDGVVQFDAMKVVESTVKSFTQEHWFTPTLLLDYLSLLWDASDNIPGVMGIGKKWAQQLVSTYGDLDSIYASLDAITGAMKQKLIDWKESAYLSRDLVTLMHVPDVPKETAQRSCDFDFEKMKAILVDKYWFASLDKMLVELKRQRQWWEQHSLFG